MTTIDFKSLNVAVVHDWLVAPGGAERVLGRILNIFPNAKLHTLFGDIEAILPARDIGYAEGEREFKLAHPLVTSYLQHLPGIRRIYRRLAPIMPSAIRSLPEIKADIVISSSWAFAHGIRVAKNVPHLAYIHSPMRWAWDMQEDYLQHSGLSSSSITAGMARWQIARLRQWDLDASAKPEVLVANSKFIQGRIKRCWMRDASILYPPVEAPARASTSNELKPHGAFITISRLVPYKRVDAIVRAFKLLPHLELIIAGDGPERKRLEAIASNNVKFAGWITETEIAQLLSGAKGFIQASKEDFGIAVVEAQACGVPVLAFGQGGALETVIDSDTPGSAAMGATGAFFLDLSPEGLSQAINNFSERQFNPEDCKRNAARFSPKRFEMGLRQLIEVTLSAR